MNVCFFNRWRHFIHSQFFDREIFLFNKLITHLFFTGGVWPQPKTQVSSSNFNTVRPTVFSFESVGNSCDILDNALLRYKTIIAVQLRRFRSRITNTPFDKRWRLVPEYLGHLDSLKVDLKRKCDNLPYMGMDESCELVIARLDLYTKRLIA